MYGSIQHCSHHHSKNQGRRMSFHLIEDSSIEDIRIGFETKVIETALKVNGYKTEKKS